MYASLFIGQALAMTIQDARCTYNGSASFQARGLSAK